MGTKTPNPVDQHVGSRVRMRRMMLGVSQEKLGYGLGLTFQQVQKYEKGVNRIGASRLQQIAGILQVPVAFFFEGAPGAGPTKGADGADIIGQFFSLPYAMELAQSYVAIAHNADRRIVADVARRVSLPV
ncbi:MAG: helix-turn-helix domain-containing protein [Rhizobiales bacterium]|nr:helix-turn-helix domain-containing protein [Hyphomicrobiales bacterium]